MKPLKTFLTISLTSALVATLSAPASANPIQQIEIIFRQIFSVPTVNPAPSPVRNPPIILPPASVPTPVPNRGSRPPVVPPVPRPVQVFNAECMLKPNTNLRSEPNSLNNNNVMATAPAYPILVRTYSYQNNSNNERWAWVTAMSRDAWVRFDMLTDCMVISHRSR